MPRIHAVSGGFLLHLDQPTRRVLPRTIRLRALVPHLLLPADADLVPPLLDDEARGLVAQHGLVFLPGGQVLSYAHQPLDIGQLVARPPSQPGNWHSLPVPEPLADRLHEIILDLPAPPAEVIIQTGGDEIGTEEPRPAGGGIIDTVSAKMSMGVGQGLLKLGNWLNMKSLAEAGSRWVQSALERVPRLSESILGKQEAALRELLRLFRDGKLDDALRRALPLGGAGSRGGVPYESDQLPSHSLRYSLGNILGGAGRPSVWFGGDDVQVELAREYRRAAEKAAAQGDYRRAAFIYGKLLRDYRSAAQVLYQGGLYHDAAIVYLSQLDDRYWAARCFAAAGEFDTALQLYRQTGRHVEAGNLLRRMGEEEAAVVEYRIAADKLAANHDWLGAGDLLNQASRPDLGQEYFEEGWKRRPDRNAVACALRLTRHYELSSAAPQMLGLVREARDYFDQPGNYLGASQFYNTVARLADQPGMESVRDELRDAALLGTAVKLGQCADARARPGDVVSSLIGHAGVGAAPVVSDAQFAFRARAGRGIVDALPATSSARLGSGVVTAVCSAPWTGCIFIAFSSGDLVCYHPGSDETHYVKSGWDALQVTSLATDADGKYLVTLQAEGALAQLTAYSRRPNGTFQVEGQREHHSAAHWLTPLIVEENGSHRVGLWGGDDLHLLLWPLLSPARTLGTWQNPTGFGALLLPAFPPAASRLAVLMWYLESFWFHATGQGTGHGVPFSWNPGKLRRSAVQGVPLAWLQHGTELELVGIDESGVLNWSRLHYADERLEEADRATIPVRDDFRTATIARPGLVARVQGHQLDWLGVRGRSFTIRIHTSQAVNSPVVAAFASRLTNEVLLVNREGGIERVPVPAG